MAERDLPPVPYSTPIIDRNGLITNAWSAFFRQLFTRVGGHVAKTNIELDENGTKMFADSGVPAGNYPGSSVGDFYIDTDTKNLYEKTGSNTWTLLTQLSGAPGTDGAAATIEIGTVTTGAAGSDVLVTNSGTTNAAVFNFTIPKGDTGNEGSGAFPYYIDEVVTVPAKRQVVLFQQVEITPSGSLQVLGRMRVL